MEGKCLNFVLYFLSILSYQSDITSLTWDVSGRERREVGGTRFLFGPLVLLLPFLPRFLPSRRACRTGHSYKEWKDEGRSSSFLFCHF